MLQLEQRVSDHIRRLELGHLEHLLIYFGNLFTGIDTVCPIFLIGIMCLPSCTSWQAFFHYLQKATYCVSVSSICVFLLKRILRRPRPSLDMTVPRKYYIRWRIANSELESLPSGDTAVAAVFSTFFFWETGHVYFFICCCLVAFARVYYHCHWVGDVVFGACLGTAITSSVLLVQR